MFVGETVYFKKERTGKYGKEGGSYDEYVFNLNDRYQIMIVYNRLSGCCGIKNLEDGTAHYLTNMDEYLISIEDRRAIKIHQLLT